MRRDKGDVKAANKETGVQQPKAPIVRRLGQRILHSLVHRFTDHPRAIVHPRNADGEQPA
jgi:hypothetical protein